MGTRGDFPVFFCYVGGMPAWLVLTILSAIAATGGLTWILWRINKE